MCTRLHLSFPEEYPVKRLMRMTEEASKYPTSLSAYIAETISANESFLLKNASDAIGEAVGLTTDAIDIAGWAVKRPTSKEDYLERSIAFFIYHAFLPYSYAIYLELLAANLPVCFIELRLLLETLVKCYLADLKYPNLSFFQEKLDALQRAQPNISRLMNEMGKEVGAGDQFYAMWKGLSEDWVHTKGFVNNVIARVSTKADAPPWALSVPMNYVQSDLVAIDELRSQISIFRNLLKSSIEKYKQELGFSNG